RRADVVQAEAVAQVHDRRVHVALLSRNDLRVLAVERAVPLPDAGFDVRTVQVDALHDPAAGGGSVAQGHHGDARLVQKLPQRGHAFGHRAPGLLLIAVQAVGVRLGRRTGD